MTPLPGLLAWVPAIVLLAGAVLASRFGAMAALIVASLAAAAGLAVAILPLALGPSLTWVRGAGGQGAVTLDPLDDALTRPFALLLVALPLLAAFGALARPRRRAVWSVLLLAGVGLTVVRASSWTALAAACAVLSLGIVLIAGGGRSPEYLRQRAAFGVVAAGVLLGASANGSWAGQPLGLGVETAGWTAALIWPPTLAVGLAIPGLLLLPRSIGSSLLADGFGGRFIVGVAAATSAYAIARSWLTAGGMLSPTWTSILVIGGALVILLGGLGGLSARRLSEIVIWGMIGQSGYFLLDLGFGGRLGATAAAWEALAAGLIGPLLGLAFRSPEIAVVLPRRVLPRAVRLRPVLIAVALAASAGLPATPAFWPRWLLLTAAIDSSRAFVVGVLLVGWLLAVANLVRLAGGEAVRPIRPDPLAPFPEGKGVRSGGEGFGPFRLAPALLLGLGVVAAGLAPAQVHARIVQPAVAAAWPVPFVPAEVVIAEIPGQIVGVAIALFALVIAGAIPLGRQLEAARDEEEPDAPRRPAAWRPILVWFESGWRYLWDGVRELGIALDGVTQAIASRYLLPFVVVAAVVTLLVLLD